MASASPRSGQSHGAEAFKKLVSGAMAASVAPLHDHASKFNRDCQATKPEDVAAQIAFLKDAIGFADNALLQKELARHDKELLNTLCETAADIIDFLIAPAPYPQSIEIRRKWAEIGGDLDAAGNTAAGGGVSRRLRKPLLFRDVAANTAAGGGGVAPRQANEPWWGGGFEALPGSSGKIKCSPRMAGRSDSPVYIYDDPSFVVFEASVSDDRSSVQLESVNWDGLRSLRRGGMRVAHAVVDAFSPSILVLWADDSNEAQIELHRISRTGSHLEESLAVDLERSPRIGFHDKKAFFLVKSATSTNSGHHDLFRLDNVAQRDRRVLLPAMPSQDFFSLYVDAFSVGVPFRAQDGGAVAVAFSVDHVVRGSRETQTNVVVTTAVTDAAVTVKQSTILWIDGQGKGLMKRDLLGEWTGKPAAATTNALIPKLAEFRFITDSASGVVLSDGEKWCKVNPWSERVFRRDP